MVYNISRKREINERSKEMFDKIAIAIDKWLDRRIEGKVFNKIYDALYKWVND